MPTQVVNLKDKKLKPVGYIFSTGAVIIGLVTSAAQVHNDILFSFFFTLPQWLYW